MIKISLPSLLLIFSITCCHGPEGNKTAKDASSAGEKMPDIEMTKKKITEYNRLHSSGSCGFSDLKKEILAFNKNDLFSIPFAENEIKRCISSVDSAHKDSVFLYFNNLYYTVVNSFSDSMQNLYPAVFQLLNSGKEGNDQAFNDFNDYLGFFGTGLYMSEGDYYTDVRPAYFYQIFKGKVSPALDTFLRIRTTEMIEGFSEDAAMLISFNQLYGRVLFWEKFIDRYPEFVLINYAYYYFNSYLSTLLTGMDNTRVFDLETDMLNPELKNLYEHILKDTNSTKATEVVTSYYHYLKRNNFKYPADLEDFMKRKGLYSMLGVQPHLR